DREESVGAAMRRAHRRARFAHRRARARGARRRQSPARHDDDRHHAQRGDRADGRSRDPAERRPRRRRAGQREPAAGRGAALVAMRALDRKLLRNLWTLKAQGLAIAFVVAGGVAMFVMSLAAVDSLRRTQHAFYVEHRFADVFADLKRAPESLAERLRAVDDVAALETRVLAPVRLQVAGYPDPVTGLAISIPDGAQPLLNRLFLREGNLPDPVRDDQVVVNEAFAEAHGLRPGARLEMVVNGRLQALTVVGTGLSPE